MNGPASEAEISSLSAMLGDVVRRVGILAENLAAAGDEDQAADLFLVEKSLESAARRLARIPRPNP